MLRPDKITHFDLDKNVQHLTQKCPGDLDKSEIRLGQKCPTTINTTIRETIKETKAPPAPLPAGGQAPAVLAERKKSRFGS